MNTSAKWIVNPLAVCWHKKAQYNLTRHRVKNRCVPVERLAFYLFGNSILDQKDGKPFDLISLPVRQMGMTLAPFDAALPVLRIQPSLIEGKGRLPDTLARLPALPEWQGLPGRTLTLSMDPELDRQGIRRVHRPPRPGWQSNPYR